MRILNNYGAIIMVHVLKPPIPPTLKKTFDFLDTLATEPLYWFIYTFFPTLISSTCFLLLRPVLKSQFLFQ